MVHFSHPYMTVGKTIALTRQTFVGKVMSLIFNMLSRFVIAFLLKSECLLISWLQSPSTVILETKKIKSVTVSTFSPSICHEVMGLDAMIFIFWILSFKPAFSLSSFTFIKRLLVSLCFLPLGSYHLDIWGYWFSPGNLDSSLWFFHMMYSACKLNKQLFHKIRELFLFPSQNAILWNHVLNLVTSGKIYYIWLVLLYLNYQHQKLKSASVIIQAIFWLSLGEIWSLSTIQQVGEWGLVGLIEYLPYFNYFQIWA